MKYSNYTVVRRPKQPQIELSHGMEDVEHIRLVRSSKPDHVLPDRLFLATAMLQGRESLVHNSLSIYNVAL